MDKELDFIDIINVLSYIIEIENLRLNEEQSREIHKHLAEQDHILIEQQNKMLQTIIEQNNTIIELLTQYKKGEDKNGPQL